MHVIPRSIAGVLAVVIIFIQLGARAQQRFNTIPLDLSTLDAFAVPPANWQIVGDLHGGPDDRQPGYTKGTGILFNNYSDKIQFAPGTNLFTKLSHSDLFLSLDFLMPKGSNSGIYFQGRYEIQLFDSWKKEVLHPVDCGSIYDRWDDARPEGAKGYEGHPPRTNACFAPNLWQHLEVEFQAPRFDASGRKISPARFVKVTLNGAVLHENIVLNGPTRSAAYTDEKATGPLMIQGDHGPVAFRNIQYAVLNDFSVPVKDLRYTYYEGKFADLEAVASAQVTRTGKAEAIDVRLADNPNASALVFNGTIDLPGQDNYQFTVRRFGHTALSVDGKEVIKAGDLFGDETVSIPLTKGEHAFELRYMKNFSWAPSGLGLSVGRLNSRPFALHAPASLPFIQPEPLIEVQASQHAEVVRSFMWHKGKKKTHVISVGQPTHLNFSYNLDQAAIMKVWRGDFLNVTDMWYERGEPQTAAPMGAALEFSGTGPLLNIVAPGDSIPMAYAGYRLNSDGTPVFTYQYGSSSIKDYIRPAENGDGLRRTLTWSGPDLQRTAYLLAEGTHIARLGNNLFVVDQRYYVRVTGQGIRAEINGQEGRQRLIVPQAAGKTLEYIIIW